MAETKVQAHAKINRNHRKVCELREIAETVHCTVAVHLYEAIDLLNKEIEAIAKRHDIELLPVDERPVVP